MTREFDETLAAERFRELAVLPEARLDLAEAALWIAAEEQPGLDVPVYLQRLDELAQAARPALMGAESGRERAIGLTRRLAQEEGFRGNAADYFDPRNSYLNEVLDRRLGIPITLSIVWVALARRLGLEAHGVGFPGHFLAMAGSGSDGPPVYVDAFAGRVVEEGDCRRLLDDMTGGAGSFETAMLTPTSPHSVLARMLRNLKQIHVQQSRYESALRCSTRILLLEPDLPEELRDRGLLNRALEYYVAAEADLSRYIALRPNAGDTEMLRRVLAQVRERTSRLH